MKDFAKVSALLAAFALGGCANPADDKPEALVSAPVPVDDPAAPAPDGSTPAATAPALPTPGPRTLAFGPADSKIDFVGSKVTGSHEGGFKQFAGVIELAEDAPEVRKVIAEIDMDSTWSDSDRLTGHLKNQDFFDVPKHPKSTFVSTEIRPGGDNGASHTIVGNLTLHGVTKSITFPATVAVADDAATLNSEFFIRRNDFGIAYPGKADDLIRDEVVIKLAVRAPRTAAE